MAVRGLSLTLLPVKMEKESHKPVSVGLYKLEKVRKWILLPRASREEPSSSDSLILAHGLDFLSPELTIKWYWSRCCIHGNLIQEKYKLIHAPHFAKSWIFPLVNASQTQESRSDFRVH